MNSQDFINAKKLIYEEKYEIINVSIHFTGPANPDKSIKDKATMIFKRENIEKEISSEEPDFIMLACSIKETFREGKEKLVEIKDTNQYYSNMNYLIPTNDKSIQDAISKLKTDKANLPHKFNLYDSFSNVINKKFNEENVTVLLHNYFEVIASRILFMGQMYYSFEGIKKNRINNRQRFDVFMKKSDELMRKQLLNMAPLESVAKYMNCTSLNDELLVRGLAHLEKTSLERWKKMSNNGTEGIEGTMGAKYMVDDYSDFFELLQKLLRDLATFINYETKEFDIIDTWHKIDTVLKKNGYPDLTSPVIIQLRHAGTHWEIDYSRKGIIRIFNTRTKSKDPILEVTYEKLLEKTKRLRDLTWATFFSYFMWREIVFFRLLDSPDLKFQLVENIRQ